MKRFRLAAIRGRLAVRALGFLARATLIVSLLASAGMPAHAPSAWAQVPLDIGLAMQLVAQHARDVQANANAPLPTDAATYSQARALLFKNNALVQEGALNGYIPNDTYQAVQGDYASLNEGFASQAAMDVGAHFTKQVSKTPSCYSPGTDSDYLVDVSSPEQVAQMQTNYNQYVSQYLDANGMLDPSEVGAEWHKQLDTDFMATDTSKVTAEQFRQIKNLNNAAYGQRESADMEKLLRKPIQTTADLSDTTLETSKTDTGLLAQQVDSLSADGTITPDRVSAYAQEMQAMAQHRTDMLADIKARGGYLIEDSSARANWFKNMALEQKYISRVETLTDALRVQNGLDPMDRGGKSIALRGSSRAAENFAVTGSAGAVADNSLSRANLELASSIAEVARTNPDFATSGAASIAQIAQNLSPADRGFLLEQVRQTAGNDFAASTASAMRDSASPADPSAIDQFRSGANEGRQRAAQDTANGGGGDSTFADWDKAMADSIGIENDLSKISSVSRVQMNQFGQKWLPKMNTALGAFFAAKELYGAGQDMGQYLDLMSAAMDSSTPDAVAQQYLASAQQIAEGMAVKGTWGAAMATVLEAFPTAGAIIGTFAIAYNGTRWVLESTGADNAVTIDLAVSGIDLANQAIEGAGTSVDRFWNGSDRAQRETDMLKAAYQRALDRGDIILRDGVTQQDLLDAIELGDLSRIHNQLVQNNPCGLAGSRVNLQAKPPVAAPVPNTAGTTSPQSAAQICNWGGAWKGSGGYPSSLTMTLTQTVTTDSAGRVNSISVAPTAETNNPDAPTGPVIGSSLTGTWSISARGGTVEYVMDPGCNQFTGNRYDCYKGTPLRDRPAPACSSGSFTPLRISYQRTSGPSMIPAGGPVTPGR